MFKRHNETVVLLHGLARQSASMAKIARALAADGYAVVNLAYPSTKKSIAALVNSSLKPELEFLRRSPNTKIHFVTHSLGGILLRVLLQTEKLPDGSRVVMLSPPNHGSEIVDRYKKKWWFKLINGPAGQQLGTQATSLPNQLNAIDCQLGIITGTKCYEPWFATLFNNENDGKVSVVSAQLPEMLDFLVLPVGHTFIMRDLLVIDQIKRFLSEGHFDHQ